MKLTSRETVVFGILGMMMFVSKVAMEPLPNIHPVGVLTISYTVVYGKKALYPLYVYVLLNGLFAGFAIWWGPYLYIWTILWGAVMLLPKNIPEKILPFVYMCLCGLHGFLFGILYAPAQAIFFGLNWQGMVAWIAAGLPFDLIHGIANFAAGVLIMPVVSILRRLEHK